MTLKPATHRLCMAWGLGFCLWGMTWGRPCQAQPDLSRWSRMVSDFEQQQWVQDLESLEPGCILSPTEPNLAVEGWVPFSPWASQLVLELERLPHAAHHADRALGRLLADDMRLFRLVQALSDRHRPAMESDLAASGWPAEWAVLPMALTGWDASYYGPGRRAGAWAMDQTTAFSLGLEMRRGWDERHVQERMNPAIIQRIASVSVRHPDSPLLQVVALVKGSAAADRFDPDALEADWLGWLHLLRVLLQVDRNFQRDRLQALWALRDRNWAPFACSLPARLHFQRLASQGLDVRSIQRENPWFTTDSIGLTDLRPTVLLPADRLQEGFDASAWCGWTPDPGSPMHEWIHEVGPGEVLGTIARRYGVRIGDIQAWNGLDGDLIRVGQALTMHCAPPQSPPPSTNKRGAGKSPSATAAAAFVWHTVQAGESFWSIASQYPGVSLADLMSANDVLPEALRPDMRIRIPQR